MSAVLHWFDDLPRRVLASIAAASIGLLGFGLYLQVAGGLNPCPMCIVQRYALISVALIAAISAAFKSRGAWVAGSALIVVSSVFGAFVAARQSWLQWFPPEEASCGRDFYGMIENFPLKRAIPMIFKGSGDCTKVDWTFLGGSIANWSFLWFCFLTVLALTLIARQWRVQGTARASYA